MLETKTILAHNFWFIYSQHSFDLHLQVSTSQYIILKQWMKYITKHEKKNKYIHTIFLRFISLAAVVSLFFRFRGPRSTGIAVSLYKN